MCVSGSRRLVLWGSFEAPRQGCCNSFTHQPLEMHLRSCKGASLRLPTCKAHLETDRVAEEPLVPLLEVQHRHRRPYQQLCHLRSKLSMRRSSCTMRRTKYQRKSSTARLQISIFCIARADPHSKLLSQLRRLCKQGGSWSMSVRLNVQSCTLKGTA